LELRDAEGLVKVFGDGELFSGLGFRRAKLQFFLA